MLGVIRFGSPSGRTAALLTLPHGQAQVAVYLNLMSSPDLTQLMHRKRHYFFKFFFVLESFDRLVC